VCVRERERNGEIIRIFCRRAFIGYYTAVAGRGKAIILQLIHTHTHVPMHYSCIYICYNMALCRVTRKSGGSREHVVMVLLSWE